MPAGYYRFPTIHDENVVFVCEDDLWSVPASGGIARRLTSNLGETSRPALSPDGSQLAFVGRDEGESEIYLMPAVGGAARRLTHLGGTICVTAGWSPDGEILFANNAEHWYLRFTNMYSLDPASGEAKRLEYGPVRSITYGPGGGVVIGRNTDDPARWKRYRGGRAGQLWIDQQNNGVFEQLVVLDGDLTSPMWIRENGSAGRIYFISDHEGVGNLYSCLPVGEDLRRHTDFEDYYVRNASTDGRRIVYHAGADLFVYDLDEGKNRLIEIDFHSPQVQRKRKFVRTSRYLQEYAIHPKGQFLATSVRGKLFTFANWEGAVIQHGEPELESDDGKPITGVRYRLPNWLSDGRRLLAVTDQDGEERFVIFDTVGNAEPILLPELNIGRPEAVAVHPHKDQIVFSNHRYEIVFLDLENHEMRIIDRGKAFPIAGFDWSPDGEWLVYAVSIAQQTIALKLWNANRGEITQITEPVLRDVAPTFDPQGKYIYFLSYRTFDPIYDNMQFDLGFPNGMKPYLITLQKDLNSPFILQPKIEEEEEEGNEDKNGDGDGESPVENGMESSSKEKGAQGDQASESGDQGEQKGVQPTQIDLDGIQRRIIAFPIVEGIYGRVLGSKDGKMLYTRFQPQGALGQNWLDGDDEGDGTLYIYNLEDQKEEELVGSVSDFEISADGETMVLRCGKRLRVLKAGEKPASDKNSANRKTGWIDLSRVKVAVQPGSEWRQMFREAWRLQRDQFWTEDMSQVDWLKVHDRYLPLVDRVSSRSEFSDLMWEMQGELSTSHCYEFGGDYRPEPTYKQGYLGADFEYDPELEAWKIVRIFQGDPWEKGADSPLSVPGVNLSTGDRILSINGRRLSRKISPAVALVNLAGEEVTLSVLPQAPDEGASPRMVTVAVLSSETPLRYREWVETNRRRVHEATDGKVGYVHIPDMGPAGYAEFHRGYLAEVDREGLVVDVRYNRGGHVSALLLEKLARRRIGYDASRWSEVPVPYPPESVIGPIVALTNEYAGSDGDIFSHGFKLMNLGPLIGKRTWGGVIGIWPRHSLVDGTITTQPEFSFWFYDVGWGVENYGTDPDIEVEIKPQDYARGYDAQLERGIEEIKHMLIESPPQLPEFTDRPNLALPKLPER